MSQTIPTLTDAAFFTIRVRLDDQDYTLEFRYNTRSETYSLTILDAEDTVLVAGLKIFVGEPLLDCYKSDTRIPRGELIPITQGSDDSPPRLGELGDGRRVELTYFTEAELITMAQEIAGVSG